MPGLWLWVSRTFLLSFNAMHAGPRCHTMSSGDRQAALHAIMDLSDVILMTEVSCADTRNITQVSCYSLTKYWVLCLAGIQHQLATA